ncbi:polynucleotide kinase-phosphatase [Arthrobacter sp. GMC3]|uniref:polynucleotide kinase-phosphatase n=1 Tax=Arthrobacter sp. GMC3 TaxID=2058894 RepID=UPI000CE35E3F|nr:polynucleotide kinase-phosphatase [Arthrobacter sp. GMC3]
MAELDIPQLCLVVLVGASGSGKSTFARSHFEPFEILSSDFFRGLVSNDENDQGATKAAFESLQFVAGKRLDAGLLTVVDATSVQPEARHQLVQLARDHDVLPVAVVFDMPEALCLARNTQRTDRTLAARVIKRQQDQLRRSLKSLGREGFRNVHILRTEEEVATATFRRQRLLNDFRDDTGPFDVIGDVHGCRAELETLLAKLGYVVEQDGQGRAVDAIHPHGRKAVFVGDLVDRGPDSPGVLRLVMGMVRNGHALAVPGNHEDKLVRALRGKNVQTGHGLAETLAQLAAEPPVFRAEVESFCDGLVSHLVLDKGRLVVAHAGLVEAYHGRASARVRSFALYGDTTGETDDYGLPVRLPWAEGYRGAATVLYGHTPTVDAEWVNGTMCLDTGCVFGGKLTALRYPEKEVVQVAAHRVWSEPIRPLEAEAPAIQKRTADMLKIDDVLGKHVVQTRTHGRIGVREQYAAGALEVMSRWATDPRWMPYLPPTMSPTNASAIDGYLEHPVEAFSGYRKDGVSRVICEEKHMGSRAVVLLSRRPERFNAPPHWRGTVYTRTGRPFFDGAQSNEFLTILDAAFERTGVWAELETDWVLLDAELLPWSLKAGDMIRNQYAAVGAAATASLATSVAALKQAAGNGSDVAKLLQRTQTREKNAHAYVAAYRNYSAPADGLDGVQLAPFQILASEGKTYHHRDHGWHLSIMDRLAEANPTLIRPTRSIVVDVHDEASVLAGTQWWESLTADGGEGMVVKPLDNLTLGSKGMVQAGIKVRGKEYLRIIYGPDYAEPANLSRLRDRNSAHKKSMALREYALGIEALERLVAGEPLWRVHQAVFAVLAMESEAVDPRL